MEFPDDILRLIKEYSRPISRPDWRTLHKMPYNKYLTLFHNEYRKRIHHMNNLHQTYRLVGARYKELFNEKHYMRIMYYN